MNGREFEIFGADFGRVSGAACQGDVMPAAAELNTDRYIRMKIAEGA